MLRGFDLIIVHNGLIVGWITMIGNWTFGFDEIFLKLLEEESKSLEMKEITHVGN